MALAHLIETKKAIVERLGRRHGLATDDAEVWAFGRDATDSIFDRMRELDDEQTIVNSYRIAPPQLGEAINKQLQGARLLLAT